MNASLPPAGWYPDPSGGPDRRFWDGTAWTEATAPAVNDAGRDSRATRASSEGAPASPPGSPPLGPNEHIPASSASGGDVSYASSLAPFTARPPSASPITHSRGNGPPRFVWIVGGLVAMVALIAFSTSGGSDDVEGTFQLVDSGYMGVDDGSSCSGSGGYGDIRSGLQVTVRDGSGGLLATSALQPGEVDLMSCVFEFTLIEVPRSEYYTFEVGRRGELSYSQRDLADAGWQVNFVLGDY